MAEALTLAVLSPYRATNGGTPCWCNGRPAATPTRYKGKEMAAGQSAPQELRRPHCLDAQVGVTSSPFSWWNRRTLSASGGFAAASSSKTAPTARQWVATRLRAHCFTAAVFGDGPRPWGGMGQFGICPSIASSDRTMMMAGSSSASTVRWTNSS